MFFWSFTSVLFIVPYPRSLSWISGIIPISSTLLLCPTSTPVVLSRPVCRRHRHCELWSVGRGGGIELQLWAHRQLWAHAGAALLNMLLVSARCSAKKHFQKWEKVFKSGRISASTSRNEITSNYINNVLAKTPRKTAKLIRTQLIQEHFFI